VASPTGRIVTIRSLDPEFFSSVPLKLLIYIFYYSKVIRFFGSIFPSHVTFEGFQDFLPLKKNFHHPCTRPLEVRAASCALHSLRRPVQADHVPETGKSEGKSPHMRYILQARNPQSASRPIKNSKNQTRFFEMRESVRLHKN
jgi:hypothetical protein